MIDSRLGLGPFGLAYVAVLAALAVLDGIWLGVISKDLYRREMGALMAESVRIAPVVAFYLLYPIAVVYLCLFTPPQGFGGALLRGFVLGATAYGAYNMTNLAIIKGWPVGLTFIDWAWGSAVTAAVAAAGYAATWGRSGGG